MSPKKRSGTSGRGYNYESLVAAMVAVKLSFDTRVTDFTIHNNVEGYGLFDDVLVIVEYQDKSKVAYAIQCKHMDQKPIRCVDFESENGKFNLNKLATDAEKVMVQIEKDFQIMSRNQIYFIIFTNAKWSGSNNTVEDFDNELEIPNTSADTNVMQFKPSSPYDSNFLSHLFLFTSQSDVSDIKQFIISLNDETIKIKYESLFTYFSNWRESKNVIALDKFTVQSKLLEWTLKNPFELSENFERSFDTGLLNNILVRFNVTLITQDSMSSVMHSTKGALENIFGINMNNINKRTALEQTELDIIYNKSSDHKIKIAEQLKKHTFLPSLTINDLYFCAWKCGLIPMTINCQAIRRTLEKLNKLLELSYVLVNCSDEFDKNRLSIFRNIISLKEKDEDIFKKTLNTFSISLQGKEEILLSTFEGNVKVLEEISPDVFIRLLQGKLQIGNRIKTDEFYIERNRKKVEKIAMNDASIKIVSGTAGMGKTYFLTNLCKRYDQHYFVSFLNASKFKFNDANITDTATLWDFFVSQLEDIDMHLRSFAKQIMLQCNKNKQFICIIDDIHILPGEEILSLKQILETSVLGAIWLSTNSSFEENLEEIFNTICFEIDPLTEQESNIFVDHYLRGINTTFTIEMFDKLLLSNILHHKFTVDRLHDLFIETELKKIYSSEPDTADSYLLMSKIAMTKFFTQEYLQSIGLGDVDEAIDKISINYKQNNIITDINRNIVTFGRSSFAEFLAAKLISEKISEGCDKWKAVFPKLFCRELTPVRKFFDFIISDSFPLHVAVLRNEEHDVSEILKNIKNLPRDKLGRTAVHLAASYGSFYNFYKNKLDGIIQDSNNEYPLDADPLSEQVSFKILESLSSFQLTKKSIDNILKYDVFEYALRSCSLENLNFIYQKYKSRNISLWDDADQDKYMYNIVKYNFHYILSTQKNFEIESMKNKKDVVNKFRNFFKINRDIFSRIYGKKDLADVAAAAGSVQVLILLLLSDRIKFDENKLKKYAFGKETKRTINQISELKKSK